MLEMFLCVVSICRWS